MTIDPPPSRQWAAWQLLDLIGHGGHGRVYRAQRPGQAGFVALKLVTLGAHGRATEPARRAFLQAAATAGRLRHPGIVRLFDAGIEGDTGWLEMELVPGGDLEPHTRAPRLLPLARVLQVGIEVALALDHAHRQGIVHRDLKPANVLLVPAGGVKVADLGLARAADASQTGTGTGTGIVPGTPAYMAPEQLAGNLPTPRSDLYALGAMLFELLAGRLPHTAETMGALLRLVASTPAPALQPLVPDAPAPLCALVARLLATRPAGRPADAMTVASELRAVLAAA